MSEYYLSSNGYVYKLIGHDMYRYELILKKRQFEWVKYNFDLDRLIPFTAEKLKNLNVGDSEYVVVVFNELKNEFYKELLEEE